MSILLLGIVAKRNRNLQDSNWIILIKWIYIQQQSWTWVVYTFSTPSIVFFTLSWGSISSSPVYIACDKNRSLEGSCGTSDPFCIWQEIFIPKWNYEVRLSWNHSDTDIWIFLRNVDYNNYLLCFIHWWDGEWTTTICFNTWCCYCIASYIQQLLSWCFYVVFVWINVISCTVSCHCVLSYYVTLLMTRSKGWVYSCMQL